MSPQIRSGLKRKRINYTDQLLEAARTPQERDQLAAATGIDPEILWRLACRADLARVKGIGAVFAYMLEVHGVERVSRLARQDPAKLHAALDRLNAAERFARRAPTLEEVEDWVEQARVLPHLLDGPNAPDASGR